MASRRGCVLSGLLRVYALLFALSLSLFLLAVGMVAWRSGGAGELKLGMLPWEGVALQRAVLVLGAAGLASVLLAGSRLRWIFPLWCGFILILIVRGFFLGNYTFRGSQEFQLAVGLTIGALAAFLGSLAVLRLRAARK